MKPRVIETYKILAVALTAGCTAAATPALAAPSDADGYPLVGNLVRKGDPPPPPKPKPKPAPAPQPSPKPA